MIKSNCGIGKGKLTVALVLAFCMLSLTLFGCGKAEKPNEPEPVAAESSGVKEETESIAAESSTGDEANKSEPTETSSAAPAVSAKPTVSNAAGGTSAVQSTSAPAQPTLNAQNVKSTFLPLIRHYCDISQYCYSEAGLDKSRDYIDVLPESWYQETGMTEWGIIGVYKFKTVKSKKELKAVYRKYLSQSILNQFDIDKDDRVVEIDGALYWAMGARGTWSYDQNSIKLVSGENGSYVVSIYADICGGYLYTEYFSVKLENGHFIIDKKIKQVMEHSSDYVIPNYKSI